MTMRPRKNIEQLVLRTELSTFKNQGELTVQAVNDFVGSFLDKIEKKVCGFATYETQETFIEIRDNIRNACNVLQQIMIGLSEIAPLTETTEVLPRTKFIPPIQDRVTAPPAAWSDGDIAIQSDFEQSLIASTSSDITESQTDPMSQTSVSSASSISSSQRPDFKAKFPNIAKLENAGGTTLGAFEDEFAMDIPSKPLNVKAPEFAPLQNPKEIASVPQNSEKSRSSSSSSQSESKSSLNPSASTFDPRKSSLEPTEEKAESFITQTEPGLQFEQSGTPNESPFENLPQVPDNSETGSAENMGSAVSSEASFETADFPTLSGSTSENESSTIRDAEDEQNELFDDPKKHSNITKKLKESIRAAEKAESDIVNFEESKDSGAVRRHSLCDGQRRADYVETVLNNTARQLEKTQDSIEMDRVLADHLEEWKSRQTLGESPKNIQEIRVPPLWTYIDVTISSVNLDTGRIHIQLLEDQEIFEKLVHEELAFHGSEGKRLRMDAVSEGFLVEAPFENFRYRAEITPTIVSEDHIEVFFVDYGNKAKVTLKDLTFLRKSDQKICKMAIPCELDDTLLETGILEELKCDEDSEPLIASVCLAGPISIGKDKVFKIVDIMKLQGENFHEIPEYKPFGSIDGTCSLDCSVIVSHVTDPKSMWLVSSEDIEIPKKIKSILDNLPPKPCSAESAVKFTNVAYKNQRAVITECKDGVFDLLLLDSGARVEKVPMSSCQRLPFLTLTYPPAAKPVCLANCRVTLNEEQLQELISTIIGATFDMRVKNNETNEVILVNPISGKYLAKELNAKYGTPNN